MHDIKQKVFILIVLSIFLLSSCTVKKNNEEAEMLKYQNTVEELKLEIKALESNLEQAEELNKHYAMKEDLFPHISNLGLQFVRAHTQGDLEKMKSLLSDDVKLVKKNKGIYGIYQYDGNETEICLTNFDKDKIFIDMVLQGFGYNEEKDVFSLHIREFYENLDGEPLTPPTFLNLYFKETEKGWKISYFEFDV